MTNTIRGLVAALLAVLGIAAGPIPAHADEPPPADAPVVVILPNGDRCEVDPDVPNNCDPCVDGITRWTLTPCEIVIDPLGRECTIVARFDCAEPCNLATGTSSWTIQPCDGPIPVTVGVISYPEPDVVDQADDVVEVAVGAPPRPADPIDLVVDDRVDGSPFTSVVTPNPPCGGEGCGEPERIESARPAFARELADRVGVVIALVARGVIR